ncbi:hypothetical protein J8273_8084 [Carpediemonas membranifera]|uniref:Uncharacterized protein n=1 Tax=Carpediemonas membranifera TaxID=201153 RepID=A0A8J6B008_9EUKA|nr:hypothetical protein J8273_8084 [Carpediemonas membranifera]|eukprot:KAG9390047.1 hypothetical protein J8273_8084 [Carpediemonas membranifera]
MNSISIALLEQKIEITRALASYAQQRFRDRKTLKGFRDLPVKRRAEVRMKVDRIVEDEKSRVVAEDALITRLRMVLASQETSRIATTLGDSTVPEDEVPPVDLDSVRAAHDEAMENLLLVRGEKKTKPQPAKKSRPTKQRLPMRHPTPVDRLEPRPLVSAEWTDKLALMAISAALEAEVALADQFSDAIEGSRESLEGGVTRIRARFNLDHLRSHSVLPPVPAPVPLYTRPATKARKEAKDEVQPHAATRPGTAPDPRKATPVTVGVADRRREWAALLKGPRPTARRPTSAPVARHCAIVERHGQVVFIMERRGVAKISFDPVTEEEEAVIKHVVPMWYAYVRRREAERKATIADVRSRAAARGCQRLMRLRRSRQAVSHPEWVPQSDSSDCDSDATPKPVPAPSAEHLAATVIQAWYRMLRDRRNYPWARGYASHRTARRRADLAAQGWAGQAKHEGVVVAAMISLARHIADLDEVDAYNRRVLWYAAVARWRGRLRCLAKMLPVPDHYVPQRDPVSGQMYWINLKKNEKIFTNPLLLEAAAAEARVEEGAFEPCSRARTDQLRFDLGQLVSELVTSEITADDAVILDNFRFKDDTEQESEADEVRGADIASDVASIMGQ